jgi:hypothetical protein
MDFKSNLLTLIQTMPRFIWVMLAGLIFYSLVFTNNLESNVII